MRRAQCCTGVRGPEAERGTNSGRTGREPDHQGFKSGLLGAGKAALVECACELSQKQEWHKLEEEEAGTKGGFF